MKKKHLLAGKKRKESRFVSVSHFRYLHYYRVNISTTTTLQKSSYVYFPRQMLQNCRNWKRKAAVVDNSRSSSKRETIISLSSSLFLDVVFFPCKMLRFFSAGVQRVKEIGFSALTFFSLLSFFSRGEKSVEVNFRKQLTSTARADNSLKIGCSSNSATVEAIPKLCTF